MNSLAELYRTTGDYQRAESLHKQALEIRKKTLGERHLEYAGSLNNLAGLYVLMSDYARAEPLFMQAREITKALGEQTQAYASSVNNLAHLYRTMGDYARAEPLYRQAMEIRKKALGEQHPEYGNSLINLAEMYQSLGDYAHTGDSGAASALAVSAAPASGPAARVPGWVADRLRRLDLNGGAVANYFQHLHDEGSPRAKAILTRADQIADALGLDDTLLGSLLKDLGLD